MRQARKPVLVQALIAQHAVEGLDVCVLIRLATLDQPQRHGIAVRPSEHRLAREFLSAIRADDRRSSSLRADLIEHAGELIAAHAVLDGDRHRLVRRIIHDHQ
jgi:hypothetical protein